MVRLHALIELLIAAVCGINAEIADHIVDIRFPGRKDGHMLAGGRFVDRSVLGQNDESDVGRGVDVRNVHLSHFQLLLFGDTHGILHILEHSVLPPF